MAAEFRQLPDLDIPDYNEALPLGPSDLKHGVLRNGMRYVEVPVEISSQQAYLIWLLCTYRYYVKKCAKPKKRAALALAVNIGSAVERDDEQGVAHIVEHLAFNATEVCALNHTCLLLLAGQTRYHAFNSLSVYIKSVLYLDGCCHPWASVTN